MIKLTELASLNESNIISEGINDPGIFKAVFLCGGTGSGKGYISKKLLGFSDNVSFSPDGLKLVNSDTAFEVFLKKAKISLDLKSLPASTRVDADSLRDKAKSVTRHAKSFYTDSMLGLCLDSTGAHVSKVEYQKNELEALGYECIMIFVNTNLETALQRNNSRERKVEDDIAKNVWNDVQAKIPRYKRMFGNNFFEIDNNIGSTISPTVQSAINKFLHASPKSPIAIARINAMKSSLKDDSNLSEDSSTEQTHTGYSVFCDMDGVLCDFELQWKRFFGKFPKQHIKEIGREKFEELLTDTPYKFWINMPWQSGGQELWSVISNYNTTILSSPSNSKEARRAKPNWLKSHGIENRLILAKASDKADYASKDHILIDDYTRNVEQWRAKGGIAIHHTNIDKTLEELAKYGIE
jgi:adenylate kinase family enzyme